MAFLSTSHARHPPPAASARCPARLSMAPLRPPTLHLDHPVGASTPLDILLPRPERSPARTQE
ncbi:hypothetical protein C8F04DRAFT_1262060 [Mycena alexandri]|uniref:Uncharacterized protein n=1 Tax=Mycena alexandri TaxID=1745969 RepID=A0AAD6SQU9_9AGAR|nr:hypothetical protein C8F04DRAFT_1262060 [Mycena alexandri]